MAMQAIALGPPLAAIVVPSSGSRAMSILGPLPGADLLADVEHRRLVALALADHHGAVDVEHVERLAHRVDGGLVGGLLVAVADQPGAGEGRGLGHADGVQRQVAVLAEIVAHASSPSRIARYGSSAAARARPAARRSVPGHRACRASVVSWLVSTIGTAWPGIAAALDQRFDRDLVVAQHGRDVGQHAGLVQHHEPDVVAARVGRHRRDRMVGERRRRHAEGRQRQRRERGRRCRRPPPRRSGRRRRRGPRGPRRRPGRPRPRRR